MVQTTYDILLQKQKNMFKTHKNVQMNENNPKPFKSDFKIPILVMQCQI